MKTPKIILALLPLLALSSCSGEGASSTSDSSSGSTSSSSEELTPLEESLIALGQAYYHILTSDKFGLSFASESFAMDRSSYDGASSQTITQNLKLNNADISIKAEGLTSVIDESGFKGNVAINNLTYEYSKNGTPISEEALTIESVNAYLSNDVIYADLSDSDNLTGVNAILNLYGQQSVEAGKYSFENTYLNLTYPLFPASDPTDGRNYDETGSKIGGFLEYLIIAYQLSSVVDEYLSIDIDGTSVRLGIDIPDRETAIAMGVDIYSSIAGAKNMDIDSSLIETYTEIVEACLRDFEGLSLSINIEGGYLNTISLEGSFTDLLTNYGAQYLVDGVTYTVSDYDDPYASILSLDGGFTLSFNYGESVSLPSDLDSYTPISSSTSAN